MMRRCLPCVGLVVFLGCFTFVIVPEYEKPPAHPKTPLAAGALPTVVIDPGHGGNDEGTKYYHLAEKDMTLDLAFRLERSLQNLNFPTVLTRRVDRYVSLSERVAVANRYENSLFVSLHFNQSNVSTVTGAETFYADEKIQPRQDWTWIGFFSRADGPRLDDGETLAGFIQASLVMRMEAVNRGIRGRSLYVVRHTRAPAVLIEAGFISNPVENQMLRNERYRQRIANAIAEGIVNYQKSTSAPGTDPTLASSEPLQVKSED